MQTLPIVESLNVLKNGSSGMGASSKGLNHTLRFEGRKETFFHGIVITVAGGTHAGNDAMFLQKTTIREAGELTATIRMMDQIGY